MDDLISKKAAIKAIDDLPNCYNGYSDTYDKAYIIGALEEVPSVDVHVARCKDCQYFHKSPTIMGQERDDGRCEWIAERLVGQDHYCSWGTERSEDAD